MAQKIKKKFIDQDLIDQIDLLDSGLSQEIIDREDGDSNTLESSKNYTDEKIADLVGSAPELLDTLEEIAEALQDEQSATGTILNQLADHEQRIEALESAEEIKEVIEQDDLASFPEVGEIGKIYVAKDLNKIYRYEAGSGGEIELPQAPAMPELTPTVSITDADDLQAAINNASNGDVIFLANGTYSYAGLSVNKEIALVGESQAGVLVQDTRTNSQTFMTVSVDNVVLKDMTIRHSTTDTNIGIAIAASGGGFPQVRLNNFRMYNVKSQYSKGGVSVRSDNFVIDGCTFEVVAGSSTRRGVMHYGNGGNSFIKNNHFINATTGALRAVTPTATSGSNPSDDQAGSLTIEGSTFSGNLSQFVNMDNHQGSAGAFELILKDNVTPETNAFLVSFGAAANFGDVFSRVVLINNQLTNSHSSGLGKGVLAIDGIGLIDYRSSALPVVAYDNVLGQLDFRTGYAEADGSIGSIVGYNTTTINQPTVSLSTGGGSSTEGFYVELSPQADLTEVEQGLTQEILDRQSGDQAIQEQVDLKASQADLDAEVSAREAADQAVKEYKPEQVIYVSKNGDDSNIGSEQLPFLTISAALASITDAAPTKRYAVRVSSGVYVEPTLALKANVFIVGENSKEAVRIDSVISLDSSFSGSADHRSGFSNVVLSKSCNFDWNEVTSAAGKLYFSHVVFNSTVSMNGYNNATAQAQFADCQFFAKLTISGINVGVFHNNLCWSDVEMNQHPNGGMATILNAIGGSISGQLKLTTTVDDFNRRCSAFLKSCYTGQITIDGIKSYVDATNDSISSSGATILNSGNLIRLNDAGLNRDLSNLSFPTAVNQPIMPANTNATNLGDWGKQWFFNFAYVHGSSGTDLYVVTTMSTYDAAGDDSGKSIFVQADSYGLKENVDGGDISLTTAATSGTGVRGKIILNAKEIDATDKNITNLADGVNPKDAVNKSQLDAVAVQFSKGSQIVGSELSYIDLDREYLSLLTVAVGRILVHEGEDFDVSVVDGKTRLTWIGSLVSPEGEEAIETGDKVFFVGAY